MYVCDAVKPVFIASNSQFVHCGIFYLGSIYTVSWSQAWSRAAETWYPTPTHGHWRRGFDFVSCRGDFIWDCHEWSWVSDAWVVEVDDCWWGTPH